MNINFLAPVEKSPDTVYQEVKMNISILPRMGEDVLCWKDEQPREVCQIFHNYVSNEIVVLLSLQHKD